MIWTLLLGIIAGWCASGVDDRLKPMVERYLPGRSVGASELRAISLSVCLFLAAIVAALSDAGGAVTLTLGGVLGVLGPRLYDKFRAMRAPDYDS